MGVMVLVDNSRFGELKTTHITLTKRSKHSPITIKARANIFSLPLLIIELTLILGESMSPRVTP